jgi:hypothetical protein
MITIEKFKRPVTLLLGTGGRLEVRFFLRHNAETHLGSECILDVLNSERAFIPVEDARSNEMLLMSKSHIMAFELSPEDCLPKTLGNPEIFVWISLINGDLLEGSLLIEMPPTRSRLSDYINLTPQFIYLYRDQNDFILNKAYILSIRHREAQESQ